MTEQLYKCTRWEFDRNNWHALELPNLTKEQAEMYKKDWEEEVKTKGHLSMFSVEIKPMTGNE